ncbi:MAG: transcription-repair coupling factor [Bacteroidales bacterium]|nr:transcription-repair coupling factor [Bacteroidales bacterium]
MEQSLNDALGCYASHPAVAELRRYADAQGANLYIKGLAGSMHSVVLSQLARAETRPVLAVLPDRDEAARCFTDLSGMLSAEMLFFFPASYRRAVQYAQTSDEAIIQRTDVFNLLAQLAQQPNTRTVIITYPDALAERAVSLDELNRHSLVLHRGEALSPSFVADTLEEFGFERVDFVYSPGQYSQRGGIVDIFSFSAAEPIRVDFFGDTIESIRPFDVDDQRSHGLLDEASIVPNIQHTSAAPVGRKPISALLPERALVWCKDTELVLARMNEVYAAALDTQSDTEEVDARFATGREVLDSLRNKTTIEVGLRPMFKSARTIEFSSAPQPAFGRNFELLADDMGRLTLDGYLVHIVADNPNQHRRLQSILEGIDAELRFTPVRGTLAEGFVDSTIRHCFYTDHQLFDRYQKVQLKHQLSGREAVSMQELLNLQKGDYVVHIDHGIGQFGGLITVDVNGRRQEAVRLIYGNNDTLLVNVHNLHKISKYRGKDAEPPKVNKLGSGTWQRLKQNTKRKIKDIAKDLIALYAKRKANRGFAFSPDSYLQHELEASFLFEDTPDQLKATAAVKADMEDERPMDRLVCGDVGFGKTEVAIRAAFKAVADSKQVAVLVPTTILALQHYQTFSARLKGLPCNIDFISRMKTAAEQREIHKRLEDGRTDIIIGTHALLSKMAKFKDLGLLIIDEEQKFGVAAKEKLKQLKVNVDTLTLTATPIPRTLQFSLMGARDLSIINTPPPNRHPILTELHEFGMQIIKEAVEHEISRGGQVFFVHNRVQNIGEVVAMLHRACPRAKTGVAHGQMDSKELERVMLSFINGDFDVLVSTSIIEAGLDIPNANTIIVNNAQMFGLSDLHQMRGRVGRSNKKAFCYLLAPPLDTLSSDARRRLRAIEEFSELGSGFSIAMQDLDIRGAGNLLGGEQSGFIADMGFEVYQRILDEALDELRDAELHQNPEAVAPAQWKPTRSECHVETDMEIHIPDTYVASVAERIKLYREIDALENSDALERFREALIDRFGAIPSPVNDLLSVVQLRWMAIELGVERIVLKNSRLLANFIGNKLSAYYSTDTFANLMAYIAQHPARFKMKEHEGRLSLSVQGIDTIAGACQLLTQLRCAVLPQTHQA